MMRAILVLAPSIKTCGGHDIARTIERMILVPSSLLTLGCAWAGDLMRRRQGLANPRSYQVLQGGDLLVGHCQCQDFVGYARASCA